MSIKSLFIVGAVLLAAGCSNDMTSPTIQRTGERASASKSAPATTTQSTTTNSATSTEECRQIFVSLGREGDSSCATDGGTDGQH